MELGHWSFMSDMAFNNYEKLYDDDLGIILANPKDELCLYPFISRFNTVLWDEKALSHNSTEVGCYVKFSL